MPPCHVLYCPAALRMARSSVNARRLEQQAARRDMMTGSGADTSALAVDAEGSQTRQRTKVPFHTPLIVVSAIAFLSPISTILYSIHCGATSNAHPNHDDTHTLDDAHHIFHERQLVSCDVQTDSAAEEELTMASIRSTSIISAIVAFVCVLLYELYRRDPIVGKYVYDRRRLTRPERTPPPLMLSRSLWSGPDDEDGEEGSSGIFWNWCRVRPAILEFIFMAMDPEYIRYSNAAYEARKKREEGGYATGCRRGCYHNNCCNQMLVTNASRMDLGGEFVDEDGYVFYPGYCHDYSHIHQSTRSSLMNGAGRNSLLRNTVNLAPPNLEETQTNNGFRWRKTIVDLFPEDYPFSDDDSSCLEGGGSVIDESIVEVGDTSKETSLSKAVEDSDESMSDSFGKFLDFIKESSHSASNVEEDDALGGRSLTIGNDSDQDNLGNSAEGDESTESASARGSLHINSVDITDPVQDAGTSEEPTIEAAVAIELANNEKGVAEKVGEGSDGYGDDDGDEVSGDNNMQSNRRARLVPAIATSRLVWDDADKHFHRGIKKLEYPYRRKYLFMPPGFHSWSEAFEYLSKLLFVPTFTRWVSRLSSSTERGSDWDDDGEEEDENGPGTGLSEAENELLRCAGLDTYLLVRLARFGFDVTFYPFLLALVTVLPVYKSCEDQSTQNSGGYLSLTINVIPEGSGKIYWILALTTLIYLNILHRLWLEWGIFIKLRHRFLANGDEAFHDSPTYLRKYRNTAIVECVPKNLRSDKNLLDVFESLFPGHVEHAEMLINTSNLEVPIKQRQRMIEKHDDAKAKYRYECWKHKQQKGVLTKCCSKGDYVVQQPVIRTGCSGERVKAIPYYCSKIEEADAVADKEYSGLVKSRTRWRNTTLMTPGSSGSPSQVSVRNMRALLTKSIRSALGGQKDLFFGTGFVTFKSIAAKQSAVQCNLSGKPHWMISEDAPDPRDIAWNNIGGELTAIEKRKILVQAVLLVGILAWGTIVTMIQRWTLNALERFEGRSESLSLEGSFIAGYLPVFVVSMILLGLPSVFEYLGENVIRFKSYTQIDEFVLLWNTGYRLANIFFIFFSIGLLQIIDCLRENPEDFVKTLAEGIIRQSAFMMNLIILATGQETMLQLVQWRGLLKQAVFRPLMNLNRKSRRYLDWLNMPPRMEHSFFFGFYAPVLSYGLMIALIFAYMVPVLLLACAIFFWVACKVHMHNALFVFCQRCEGGGKLFYYWNRIVFITLYSSTVIFAAVLSLKEYPVTGILFFFIMTLCVYAMDKAVKNTFVINSLNLPMSIARLHDEEEATLFAASSIREDGGEKFMYRNPILNQENWNAKPSYSWFFSF